MKMLWRVLFDERIWSVALFFLGTLRVWANNGNIDGTACLAWVCAFYLMLADIDDNLEM